jgi:hypothetical protein
MSGVSDFVSTLSDRAQHLRLPPTEPGQRYAIPGRTTSLCETLTLACQATHRRLVAAEVLRSSATELSPLCRCSFYVQKWR